MNVVTGIQSPTSFKRTMDAYVDAVERKFANGQLDYDAAAFYGKKLNEWCQTYARIYAVGVHKRTSKS